MTHEDVNGHGVPLASWRYSFAVELLPEGSLLWTVREVLYWRDGSLGWSAPIGPLGDSHAGLCATLKAMGGSRREEVLDLRNEPGKLVPLAEVVNL